MGRGDDRREDESMPLAETPTRGAVRIRRMDSRQPLAPLAFHGTARGPASEKRDEILVLAQANKRRNMITCSREAVPGVVQGFGRHRAFGRMRGAYAVRSRRIGDRALSPL